MKQEASGKGGFLVIRLSVIFFFQTKVHPTKLFLCIFTVKQPVVLFPGTIRSKPGFFLNTRALIPWIFRKFQDPGRDLFLILYDLRGLIFFCDSTDDPQGNHSYFSRGHPGKGTAIGEHNMMLAGISLTQSLLGDAARSYLKYPITLKKMQSQLSKINSNKLTNDHS